jgi:predicted amidohydrolase
VGTDANGHQYSGDTLIADPLGTLLYHKENEEDVHTVTINKHDLLELRERLPFYKDADQFKVIG